MQGFLIFMLVVVYGYVGFGCLDSFIRFLFHGPLAASAILILVPIATLALTGVLVFRAARNIGHNFLWFVNDGDITEGRMLMLMDLYKQYVLAPRRQRDEEAQANAEEGQQTVAETASQTANTDVESETLRVPDGYGCISESQAPFIDRTVLGVGMATNGLKLERIEGNRVLFREKDGSLKIFPIGKPVVLRGACYSIHWFDDADEENSKGYYCVDEDNEWASDPLSYEGPAIILRAIRPEGPGAENFILIPAIRPEERSLSCDDGFQGHAE